MHRNAQTVPNALGSLSSWLLWLLGRLLHTASELAAASPQVLLLFLGYLCSTSVKDNRDCIHPDHVAALLGKWSDRCVLSVWAVRGKPLYVLCC